MTRFKKYNKGVAIKGRALWFMLCMTVFHAYAQLPVNFTPRTSDKAPAPYTGAQNYYLQGDFVMIGNTNLTLVNYGDNTHNGNPMRFVDIDNVSSTFNSSSAQLVIPDAACSEIIYAGLYWTGRAHNTGSSPNVFNSTKGYSHGFQDDFFTLSVTLIGSGSNTYPRYTLTSGGSSVEFEFTNNTNISRVQYRIGTTGTFINVPVSYSSSNNLGTAVFNSPLSLTLNGNDIVISRLERDSRVNRTVAQQRLLSSLYETKSFDKRKVKFRKDNLAYQDIETTEIFFPNGTNDNLFSGYADVTDYVRQHGVGNYFVADIATQEGTGGAIGYSAGWGMVVIYKNPALKWRDITVFDGYGSITTGGSAVSFNVAGFRAAQRGEVKIKLGVMAGEGDNFYSGDYFNIRNAAGAWRRIAKNGSTAVTTNNGAASSGNSNFFNSSVIIDGARNPSYTNNTGVDIVTFELANPWENTPAPGRYSIIPNNATSTAFQFGTNQDAYSLFNIVFAVDAYVPEVIGENTATGGTMVHGGDVNPGADLDFDLKLFNKGEEPVNGTKVEIQIPHNVHYVSSEIVRPTTDVRIPFGTTVNWVPPAGAPTNADPAVTPGGTLVWDIGTLPLDLTKNKLLGTLKYKLRVTTDCVLLASAGACGLDVRLNGKITGIGATSLTAVDSRLVREYGDGACPGPIFDDFESKITPGADFINNCGLSIEEGSLQFKGFCSLPGNVFPRAEIAGSYPAGTKFFSSPPASYASTTNVVTGDFAVNPNGGKITYYAMMEGMAPGCYYVFQTSVEVVTTSPTVNNIVLCFGEPVILNTALSATGTANSFDLYYYETAESTTPLSAPPAPTAAGTHTYWVAEGKSQGGVLCIGPKVEFTITIYEQPTVAQDAPNLSLCENNDAEVTVAATGATSYAWEYTTAAAPTVWLTLDNSTFSGQVALLNNTMNVSHAVRVGTNNMDGIKVRLKAINGNGCEAYSNEISVEVKDCRAITNPMLPNKAGN